MFKFIINISSTRLFIFCCYLMMCHVSRRFLLFLHYRPLSAYWHNLAFNSRLLFDRHWDRFLWYSDVTWACVRTTQITANQLNYLCNSSPSSVACIRQWIGSALVQIMACRLFGAEPLSKPNAGLLTIGPSETNFSELLIKIQNFSFFENASKISSAKCQPFCSAEMS